MTKILIESLRLPSIVSPSIMFNSKRTKNLQFLQQQNEYKGFVNEYESVNNNSTEKSKIDVESRDNAKTKKENY